MKTLIIWLSILAIALISKLLPEALNFSTAGYWVCGWLGGVLASYVALKTLDE